MVQFFLNTLYTLHVCYCTYTHTHTHTHRYCNIIELLDVVGGYDVIKHVAPLLIHITTMLVSCRGLYLQWT